MTLVSSSSISSTSYTFSNFFNDNIFDSIQNSTSYQFISDSANQASNALSWTARYLFHIGAKIIAAYETEELFKLPTLFLGVYLVGLSVSKVPRIILGDDSWMAKKSFLNKALFEPNLPLIDRLSNLHRAAFGSISGRNRAKLIAQAVIPAFIGACLIRPFLIKQTPNFPDFNERFNGYLNPNTGSTISANMVSKSREQYVKDVIPYYLANTQKFQETIQQDIIHPNAIGFAETVLNPDYTSPLASALKSNLLYGVKTICNWTVGLTAFGATCDRLQPTPSFNIFSEDNHGNTVINSTRLAEACDETLKWADTLPLDSDATQANYFATACNYTVGHFNSTKCDELYHWISPKNGTATRNMAKAIATDICDKLIPIGVFRSPTHYDYREPKSYYKALPELAKTINNLNPAMKGGASTPLDNLAEKYPEHLNRFTMKFFNITDNLNAKTLKTAVRKLAKITHPDKKLGLYQALLQINNENESNDTLSRAQTSQIYQAKNSLTEIYKDTEKHPNLFNHNTTSLASNSYYTISELKQKVWDFFQPPAAEKV